MRRSLFGVLATLALLVGILAAAPAGAAPPASSGATDVVVVLQPTADPGTVAQAHGVSTGHVYRHALKGFSARVSQVALDRLQADPRVMRVELDREWSLAAPPWCEEEPDDFRCNGDDGGGSDPAQEEPTGTDRIEADQNRTNVTHAVAVIDTGIDGSHPDLNVAGGINFTGGSSANWNDGHGHGTHVAGTIGAIDNDIGVVGVAPGAALYAVKVCNNGGRCSASAIIAGIDWVAQKKSTGEIDFAAANYSISSADSDNDCGSPANAIHEAICGLVDEGVVFVLAAGNDNRVKTPFPVTFSVSAIADFDGKAGGKASPTCRSDTDDTLANFSNHGEKVNIAAPGVCILSTWKGGDYNTISGTSMATPHVTGAVALYLQANGLSPAQNRAGADAIKDAIIGAAHPQGTSQDNPCSYDDSRTGGPLLFVNDAAFGGNDFCEVAGS